MASRMHRSAYMALGLTALALAGCGNYVKRADYDADIAELRATDQRLQQQIDTLSQEMAKHGAEIEQMKGRVRVNTTTHFDFDDATVREQDKPQFDDFARVVSQYHSDALITVEGFADPAGSAAYNKQLGQRRAEAVRDYLVSSGLSADRVRAVSYGEDRNRQVHEGAWGENGEPNRRVALVVDYVGAAAM